MMLLTDRNDVISQHLNEQQLIHMNGRIYDYNLGRFMSVDPFIQSPTSTQGVNPYSYIMNNPLAGTDPTGYYAECPDKIAGCKPNKENPERKERSGRGFVGGVIYQSSDNGSSRQSSSATGTQKTEAIGSPKQNANKQNPSYGNDANFAKGYGSLKGDMSGIMSLTPIGQAVDSIKSGIEGVETALEEYDRTGSLAGAAWAGTAFALEKYVEHKLKIGRGPDVNDVAANTVGE